MVFVSICTAIYDYVPQSEGELEIHEGELVYILEKSTEDEWWKAKKKAPGEEEEEPTGLIPNNYVIETQPTHHAKALYDYSRQTDEEISFSEDAALLVYDTSDPDWTLVGYDGEFGFAPANYIEITEELERGLAGAQEQQTDRELPPIPNIDASANQGPVAALAGILHKQAPGSLGANKRPSQSMANHPIQQPQYTPDASDEDPLEAPPSLPQRPKSEQSVISPTQASPPLSPPLQRSIISPPATRTAQNFDNADSASPAGFSFYNVNEMVSAMGKQKKMPTTLGINLITGTITIAPEKSRDGPQQEWSADKLTHYSNEGKHVFMELVKPSKSLDFHAGAKDTAHEIVATLGELAGAAKAEGLREVIAAGSGAGRGVQRKGQMLYEFMAQGSDEVTVAAGDEVIILDDSNEEWWQVRRVRNGKEGVVPSSFVEALGISLPPEPSRTGLNAGRSTIDQNRLEEHRQTKEALKLSKSDVNTDVRKTEVGPGMKLPTRGSSLMGGDDSSALASQRSKRNSRSEARSSNSSSSKSKPDITKTRTWTDRSGSFKVEAEFIGLKDAKIHLHKLNGVKIAVPVGKMAIEDLEYVEKVTGVSLDEDKPLSDIRRRSQKEGSSKEQGKPSSTVSEPGSGASVVAQQSKRPDFDWFDFFLKCGVNPSQCERYSFNFIRDSMDDTVLPDITPTVLNTLGLKQGDILRVMKFLDSKYGRSGAKSKLRNVSFGGEEVMGNEGEEEGTSASPSGGLFSGPGGTLKNNTRKSRPAPPVQTNDTIDPKAFQRGSVDESKKEGEFLASTRSTTLQPTVTKKSAGFDDDAWDVKPLEQPQPAPATLPSSPSNPASIATQATLTGSMADLSLLSQPLQPVIAHSTGVPPATQNQQMSRPVQQPVQQQQSTGAQLQQPQSQQQQQQQPPPPPPQSAALGYLQQHQTGASPSFFASLGTQVNGAQNFIPPTSPLHNVGQQPVGISQQQSYSNQPQGFNPQPLTASQPGFQLNTAPRQRPQAPQFNQQGSLMPPPPQRPLSAPQNVSPQNNFGAPPLQPQLTGIPAQASLQNQVSPSAAQSLDELSRLRMQQQFVQQPHQFQQQPNGFSQPNQAFNQYGTGFNQQPNIYGQQTPQLPQASGAQMPSQYINGQPTGGLYPDLRSPPTGSFPQLTASINGFASSAYSPTVPQHTGSINSILPPALQPQQTGINGFNAPHFNQSQPPTMPPILPLPQQHIPATLQPQKTGPAPPVHFGVAPKAKTLLPQVTGRRANLSQATPQNPFGF